MLIVSPNISIPDAELKFTFSRSSGPGGQNVNKVNSKATMHWNVRNSSALPIDVKARFLTRYASRLTNDGDVVIAGQRFRDQPKNIEDCQQRLVTMILQVLEPPKRRRVSKPTRASKTRRLNNKRHQATKKQGRSGPVGE